MNPSRLAALHRQLAEVHAALAVEYASEPANDAVPSDVVAGAPKKTLDQRRGRRLPKNLSISDTYIKNARGALRRKGILDE
jgi:hypothetical protein